MQVSWNFAIFAVFVVGIALCSSSPVCESAPGSIYNYLICSGFNDPIELKNQVQRHQNENYSYLLLKDSNLEYIPPALLSDATPLVLEFNNVTVQSYSQPGTDINPFAGLETSLRKIVFSHNSSLPQSWTILGHLSQLEELKIYNITQVDLTGDFNGLPRGLKELHIIATSIGHAEDQWLADLRNLEVLSIMVTNLRTISREMLPKPAPKLAMLQLAFNNLTSLPGDLTRDLPALNLLILRGNRITAFAEETFTPLNRNGTLVDLELNPLKCDCSQRWLANYPDRWHYPVCRSATHWDHRYVMIMHEPDFCDNVFEE